MTGERFGPHPPAVCFGTGGSGTRAVAEIMQAAGIYLGPKLNGASDAITLKPFLRRWPERYLEASGWVEAALRGEPSAGTPDPEMASELAAAIAEQREGIPAPNGRWGWKAPRTISVLPLVFELFPGARTIQLVRDGRDMAFSRNQKQLEAWNDVVVGDLAAEPEPVRSIALWSRLNLAAVRCARTAGGDNHLVVRYEDLCANPRGAAVQIAGHLGIEPSAEALDQATELVSPSASSGRWREQDEAEIEAVRTAGAEGLAEFGYAERD